MKEMIPKVGRPTEFDTYETYDSIDECAEKAVEVFKKNQWTWSEGEIQPNFEQIKASLEHHESGVRLAQALGLPNSIYETSGRLIFKDGKYGHQILDAEELND